MNLSKLKADFQLKSPLVHCITNPISINQCANAILSLGARPITAEHPKEIKEITSSSQALLLNLGNITDARIKSIKRAVSVANSNNIPTVIDMVGVACSSLRHKLALSLCRKYRFSVIKGNYSEIYSLYNPRHKSSGVDSDVSLDEAFISQICISLSQKYNAVILASGKTDIISNGLKTVLVHNGTPQLSSITGTGCMLGAICASFLCVSSPFDAAQNSCVLLGICGEKAQTLKGGASFMQNLIDKIYSCTDEEISSLIRKEEKEIEYT
ncbi:MAG: hydroxyethylthiazole kinase [Clostridia bacterium]|nr:hydroxyethylthiazole kinase [Clostridia bacterium]